jgi:hypothetical protein
MDKKLLAVIVLAVIALLSIAGCTSSTSSNQAASSTPSVSATPTGTRTGTPTVIPTIPLTITPTLTPLIATTIKVWMGYMGEPALWLTAPSTNPVAQGQPIQVRYWVNASDGTTPCGAANYYIDNQAAGGQWMITTPQPQYWTGCPEGLPGGAGGLYLSGNDTAKLSLGWHTLQIYYLGEGNYAPSEFVAQFLVVNG